MPVGDHEQRGLWIFRCPPDQTETYKDSGLIKQGRAKQLAVFVENMARFNFYLMEKDGHHAVRYMIVLWARLEPS